MSTIKPGRLTVHVIRVYNPGGCARPAIGAP